MKVALIIERMEPWRGGAETSTVQFAGHLARLGVRIHILTTTCLPSTPEFTVVPIRASSRLRGARAIGFNHRVARYVREHDYDIVHSIVPCSVADIYQPRGGTVPEMLDRNLAIRSAAITRKLKQAGQILNLKYRAALRAERRLLTRRPAPWVISISKYVTDQLRRHYKFDPSRIREIFNGVDPDLTSAEERARQREEVRRQFHLRDDDLMVLCVAHNFKLKGVDKLVEALSIVYRRQSGHKHAKHHVGHCKVVIVGRDNPRRAVQLARRLGVADHVLFAGPTQRILAFFHAADVLAHPTFYDPCSRVVLEAMAAGLPVITTRFNGAAERVTEGREGFVIESPMDVEALADRMIRLMDNDCRRLCAAAAPSAVSEVTMKAHAEKVCSLYRELLTGGYLQREGYR